MSDSPNLCPTFAQPAYRGRLAPSPTGYLHLGHARTFWTAQQRCQQRQGTLVLRSEDLDLSRCRPAFSDAMVEDLRWFGLCWQEGPDCGGPCAPYVQSQRLDTYRAVFDLLRRQGSIYPCSCSRKDVASALAAPHQGEEEPVYPGRCRPELGQPVVLANGSLVRDQSGRRVNWRFRVNDGESIRFTDHGFGPQEFVAGRDFGDFVVWRADGFPSYQLAVVADDHTMGITEVVRGADLLISTARQLLLYRALGWPAPAFFHCPLLTDAQGVRLAKRHDALALRSLRLQGAIPETLRAAW